MLWKGQVLWGMMVYDSLRGIDYLVSRPDVDASRIATLGLSMGSTMAWWVAALDERVKVMRRHLLPDGLPGADRRPATSTDTASTTTCPSLLKHFTTAQINALIAPRAHLSLAGNLDAPDARRRGWIASTANSSEVYAAAGRPDNWKLLRYDAGHQETAEGRREILAFLKEKL